MACVSPSTLCRTLSRLTYARNFCTKKVQFYQRSNFGSKVLRNALTVGFGWICDGAQCGSETKNRTFAWWLDLAE